MYYKQSVPINKVGNKVNVEFSLASSILIDENDKFGPQNAKRESNIEILNTSIKDTKNNLIEVNEKLKILTISIFIEKI